MLKKIKFEAKIQWSYYKFGFINFLFKMEKRFENANHKVLAMKGTTVLNSMECKQGILLHSANSPFQSHISGAMLVIYTCKICFGRLFHTC